MVPSYRLAGRYLLPDKVKRRKEDTMISLKRICVNIGFAAKVPRACSTIIRPSKCSFSTLRIRTLMTMNAPIFDGHPLLEDSSQTYRLIQPSKPS